MPNVGQPPAGSALKSTLCGHIAPPYRMEGEIVVSDSDFFWRALVKNCDEWRESTRIELERNSRAFAVQAQKTANYILSR